MAFNCEESVKNIFNTIEDFLEEIIRSGEENRRPFGENTVFTRIDSKDNSCKLIIKCDPNQNKMGELSYNMPVYFTEYDERISTLEIEVSINKTPIVIITETLNENVATEIKKIFERYL